MACVPYIWLLLFSSLSICGHGQSGFLNIDCGKDRNQRDATVGLDYVTEEEFVDTGVNHKVSPETLRNGLSYYSNALDLRSFPNGSRNCYSLPVVSGNKYLVRAAFLYGNYDGKEREPRFDLHLDTNLWCTVVLRNASINYNYEIIAVARSSRMWVCLLETGFGEPFISSLELRPVPSNLYPEANASQPLVRLWRMNFGSKDNLIIRYPSDVYDRLWFPFSSSLWTAKTTSLKVSTDNPYEPPNDVMRTAVTPSSDSSWIYTLTRSSKAPPTTNDYYIFLHFAELQSNGSRVFNISLNGERVYGNVRPKLLSLSTFSIFKRRAPVTIEISLDQTSDSSLPPIINAVEVYRLTTQIGVGTDSGDLDAIMRIKEFYRLVKRNWMGDPCNPIDSIWDGLNCTYDTTKPSRIMSLKLAYFGLTGEISPSFGKLLQLQSLDLSMNNLAGGIPTFLGDLPVLAFLNLTGSGLNGPIPKSLQDRVSSGSLKLSFEPTKSSSKKNNTSKTVVAVVASIFAVVIFVSLGIFAIRRHRRQHRRQGQYDIKASQEEAGHVRSEGFPMQPFLHESKQFTYAELVEMTNNFAMKIGQGGFGIVYHGRLQDNTEVAVKMLSKSSKQGPKEFLREAQLSTKIYHKNLVPLLGFSRDNNTLSLVYEYMSNGSLADHLSGARRDVHIRNWRARLQIGIEAAQGLEYLHSGCKPAVIHRDVKTSNILLSHDFEAKIADFGLSKILYNSDGQGFVSTSIMGTPGYLDPEYSNSGKLNEKSDVYSFGIVLLELITGRPPIMRMPEMTYIVTWVEPLLAKGDLQQIVDQELGGEYNPHSIWKTLEVTMACLALISNGRPTMYEVVSLLKDCMKLESTMQTNDSISYYSSGSKEQFVNDTISFTKPFAR